MRDTFRRTLGVLFAVMLVSSAGFGPVGTAAASHECDTTDVTLGLYKNGMAEAKDMIFGGDRSGDLDDNDGALGLGCDLYHGSSDVDAEEAVDRASTKQEITSASATAAQWANDDLVGWENAAHGIETEARLDGLAAYGRALDNDSSKATAKEEAKQAATDLIATKQNNLAEDWNKLALAWKDYAHQQSTEGLSKNFVGVQKVATGDPDVPQNWENRSYSLVGNEGSVDVLTATFGDGNRGGPFQTYQYEQNWSFVTGYVNDSYTTVRSPWMDEYKAQMTELEDAHANVTGSLDTYIEESYAAAESGTIDWSQAVGATALDKHFASEGNFQSWAAIKLRNMKGVGMPENLSQVGFYTVTHDGLTKDGILLSEVNPASGGFERGESYDGSALEGPQYLVANQSIMDLDGQFTIEDITNDKGETVNKTVINNVTYETTDTDDLQRILEENQKIREELEAREEALRNQSASDDGGGGLLAGLDNAIPGLNAAQTGLLLLLVALAALLYAGRDESATNIVERKR